MPYFHMLNGHDVLSLKLQKSVQIIRLLNAYKRL